jgi:hypothetical protein
MSRDLLGEKTALDQTRIIANGIPKELPMRLRNQIVHTILEQQLKNFTNYNRFQRRKTIKELLKKQTKGEQKPFPAPPILKNKSDSKVLNKKQDKNIAGQGSQ